MNDLCKSTVFIVSGQLLLKLLSHVPFVQEKDQLHADRQDVHLQSVTDIRNHASRKRLHATALPMILDS